LYCYKILLLGGKHVLKQSKPNFIHKPAC